jgi:hypothetical protein
MDQAELGAGKGPLKTLSRFSDLNDPQNVRRVAGPGLLIVDDDR